MSIVLRPGPMVGPVQGPGSGFWPSRPSQFFFLKKNQNDVVLVKKTKNIKVNGFEAGSCRVSQVPGRPGQFPTRFWPPCRAGSGFKTMHSRLVLVSTKPSVSSLKLVWCRHVVAQRIREFRKIYIHIFFSFNIY